MRCLLLLFMLSATADSASTPLPPPYKMALYSAILPGWGQVKNGKPLKALLIWGAMGGLTAEALFLNERYQRYRQAHRCRIQQPEADCSVPPEWANLSPETLRQYRDAYRNARDLFWLLLVAAYALNVLDAYVEAHFRTFDVGPELAGLGNAPGLRVRWRL